MFRIPSFYQEDISYDESVRILQNFGGGDLLEGMRKMDAMWAEYVVSSNTQDPMYDEDDEFFSAWVYEVNAFNVVYDAMAGLFQEEV